MTDKQSLRVAYGQALVSLGQQDDRVVVFDADLSHATMTKIFAESYPDRFYNFGIAESNMVCAAAGFAEAGLMPFVSTFALFGAGRAYEMIRNAICYINANVKFGFSHSGLSVGEDGGSHQSIEDIALMRVIPGMTIFVPCDPLEMRRAVFAAAEINGPVYIRVARPVVNVITTPQTPFIPGKANMMREGGDVCIMATGLMVPYALEAADMLGKEGVHAAVVNFHTLKPIDDDCILNMASRCGAVVTAEEHSIIGGLGSAVAEIMAGNVCARFARIGIADKFGKSGKPEHLFKEYKLTAQDIAEKCKLVLQ